MKPICIALVLSIAAPAAASDTAIVEAKSAMLAKLRDPQSAQFGTFTHSTKPNANGISTDVVCGTVNAKNGFGGYIGAKPFAYLVRQKMALYGGDEIEMLGVETFCR